MIADIKRVSQVFGGFKSADMLEISGFVTDELSGAVPSVRWSGCYVLFSIKVRVITNKHTPSQL